MECQAIYGKAKYEKAIYGDPYCTAVTPKNTYAGIPLGNWVRKQLNHSHIFRVQRGNGNYNAKTGVLYQHRYKYFVPASITHVNGDASRALLADAVSAWQGLSNSEKILLNEEAHRHYRFSGYNLYIKRYMLSNY